MNTDYHQITVTVRKQYADIVSEFLTEHGALAVTVEGANEQELFDAAAPSEPGWDNQKLTALYAATFCPFGLMDELSKRGDVDNVAASRLMDQEWERSWLEQFEPVKINQRLWVCPSWLIPPDPTAINLIIDPGLAFGTGTHETTQLCLAHLSTLSLTGKKIIDLGCGSGILAIAALRLGAEHAVAIDVDTKALAATQNNAQINGVDNRLTTCLPDQMESLGLWGSANLVIANILAGTLLELHDPLTRLGNVHSSIMLSGVLHTQSEQIVSAFSPNFSLQAVRQNDWMLLHGPRTNLQ